MTALPPAGQGAGLAVASLEVPASLRTWFVVHAIVDVLTALPLLVVPEEVLPRFGWPTVDPVSARLVAAALLAIGVRSWRARHASPAVYRELLALKMLWSGTAVLGLMLAIARGAPPLAFLLLSIFLAFFGIWSHYAIRFRQLARAPADEDPPSSAEPDRNRPGGSDAEPVLDDGVRDPERS